MVTDHQKTMYAVVCRMRNKHNNYFFYCSLSLTPDKASGAGEATAQTLAEIAGFVAKQMQFRISEGVCDNVLIHFLEKTEIKANIFGQLILKEKLSKDEENEFFKHFVHEYAELRGLDVLDRNTRTETGSLA